MPIYPAPSAGFTDTAFRASSSGQASLATAGMLGRPLTACSAGTSLMTGLEGFAATLQYALMRYHDAYLTFDHRKVLTSVSDATVVANRGDAYATSTSNSTHMAGPQRTQFNTDVAAGRRFDILFTDAGLYNDGVTNQAGLDACMANLLLFVTDFFNPTLNNGKYVVIQGTGGFNPTLVQSWSAMCRRLERTSGGRIRFYDAASVLIAPNVTTWGTAAAGWRKGRTGLGASSVDGTHPSFSGSRYIAEKLWPILLDICPATWPRGGSLGSTTYDSANLRWGDVLGGGSGMLGVDGLDGSAGGGSFSGNVVGNGGQSSLNNTWYLNFAGGVTVTPTITTSSEDVREQTLVLGGNSAGGNIQFQYRSSITDVNNGSSTRRFMAGIDVEFISVTGAVQPTLWFGAQNAGPQTDLMPVSSGGIQDGLPDTTSAKYRMRLLRAITLPSGNLDFGLFIPIRAVNPVAGTVKITRPWAMLVEE